MCILVHGCCNHQCSIEICLCVLSTFLFKFYSSYATQCGKPKYFTIDPSFIMTFSAEITSE
jgi:drug/metabolite transporter (DMT)-like permease